ncbi:rab GTPase-binding effector protein 2-like [Hemiscyllium ocellatum]|uniref:rab GTPase-binding effector protein 2-like n=1 Tax=Hemiscyllium ocellatum TaxID=170820 RepID=UPI002966B69F|nr:rab GTPase-binding effector protein 2-like [Hemiscyllium ocellatum]
MAELMETQKELCQKNRLLHRENKAVRALCLRLQGKAEDSQGRQIWPSPGEDCSEAGADKPSHATGEDHFLDEAYNEVLNRLEEKLAEVETLRRQRQQMEQERAELNLKIQEEKAKGQRLQVELDTSEQVQRDFVKLSQALQVRLEQIRQSDSLEAIRQIVDSVSSLKDASQLQGAWEPAS